MIIVKDVTKQDRLSMKIQNGLASMIIATRKEVPYDDWDKNGLNNDSLMGIIDFGIGDGTFMPPYTLKDWLKNTRDFFDYLPPHNILVAIYKELQKHPQGSIKGHQ
ncbi:MAG: hypothetical protein LBU18_04055 [Treponema sp.]|nr:hypothetical protein [Treponema sp.]